VKNGFLRALAQLGTFQSWLHFFDKINPKWSRLDQL